MPHRWKAAKTADGFAMLASHRRSPSTTGLPNCTFSAVTMGLYQSLLLVTIPFEPVRNHSLMVDYRPILGIIYINMVFPIPNSKEA